MGGVASTPQAISSPGQVPATPASPFIHDVSAGQLFVSLRLENVPALPLGLVPHAMARHPLLGSADPRLSVSVLVITTSQHALRASSRMNPHHKLAICMALAFLSQVPFERESSSEWHLNAVLPAMHGE